MTDLINWFVESLNSILVSLCNAFINLIINPAIAGIGSFFETVASILPTYHPTIPDLINAIGSQYLSYLNWLLPIPAFIAAFSILSFSYTARFVISPALRWFKLVK